MKYNLKMLFDAIEAGDKSKVEEILDSKEVDINSTDSVGLTNRDGYAIHFVDITPFMMACALGQFRIAEMLRERGANCMYVNKAGNHALHIACMLGREMSIMYCRIQCGMEIDDKCIRLIYTHKDSINLDSIDKDIKTVRERDIMRLDQLISCFDMPLFVKYFLYVKGDEQIITKSYAFNLLELAKKHSKTETVKVMEEYMAQSKPTQNSNITLNDVMQFLNTHRDEPSLTISTPSGVSISFSAAAILDAITPKQKFTSVKRSV